jgi:hypothetical protein
MNWKGKTMIKIEKAEVLGWEHAIRGARNPMNSWANSDSGHCASVASEKCSYYAVGANDLDLMTRLRNAGTDHRKFMRMVTVYVDLTAPLYWWKEMDTYKVGTVANSCSTMHKIHAKEFAMDDFSHEHLVGETDDLWVNADGEFFRASALDFCQITCDVLNHYRKLYLETKDKRYWWQMIQLLPSSYNQKRTVMLNYEVLANIYKSRKNHKLDEWHTFCAWIESLPYSELITG